MRVIVVGTGRCGTMTFSKACGHITNYTSNHETKAGVIHPIERFTYPDNHIEVDPHISWTLGLIVQLYPDAFFVHLQRRKEEVVRSWLNRGIHKHKGPAPLVNVMFQSVSDRLDSQSYRRATETLYDSMIANIELGLSQVNSIHVWLHEAQDGFLEFWQRIYAEGDFDKAISEFEIKYNQSH